MCSVLGLGLSRLSNYIDDWASIQLSDTVSCMTLSSEHAA